MLMNKRECNGMTALSFVLLQVFCLKLLHLAGFPKGEKNTELNFQRT